MDVGTWMDDLAMSWAFVLLLMTAEEAPKREWTWWTCWRELLYGCACRGRYCSLLRSYIHHSPASQESFDIKRPCIFFNHAANTDAENPSRNELPDFSMSPLVENALRAWAFRHGFWTCKKLVVWHDWRTWEIESKQDLAYADNQIYWHENGMSLAKSW